MNKSKCLFLGTLLFATSAAFAQTSNIRKAKSAYGEYEKLQQAGGEVNDIGMKFLTDAVEPIDAAVVHDRTKENPEAWTFYSLIYGNLAFVNKDADAASKALEGIEKAKEFDSDDKFVENLDIAKANVRNYYQVIGADAWQEQNFAAAYTAFDEGLKISPGDTTLTYYAGIAAIQNEDYTNAIEKYESLVPITDYSDHRSVVNDLPKLLIQEGDTTRALEYAAKAVEAYPEDAEIIIQNIEFNLMTGNEAKIISEIEEQIAKDGQNKQLYFYLGLARSSSGDQDGAIEAYKQAVAIDPNYTEANLNIAALIMNSANEELMALNDDRSLSTDAYNAGVEQVKTKMSEAIPYLERVVEADPSNRAALRNLKGYYDFVQDEEKSAEMQARLDENP